ncbi:MAG: hypothetical protein FWG36_06745 [Oscillospiraceae bacterium]|nr:hypothetical protein [Oscillospiraceae bacterium]
MNNLLNTIIQKMTWKKAIIFTLIFAAFFVLINFSAIGVAGLLEITNGANILDFEFGYTYEEAHSLLTALETEGRAFYLNKILPIDYPFPFAYALFYVGLIALLLKHIKSHKLFGYSLLVPIFAMLFDWTENIGLIAMLRSYPNLSEWSVQLASVTGMLKTVFTYASIAIIAGLFIVFVYSKLRRK